MSYWLQTREGQDDLDGFRVNSELKNLGYGVSNVTRAFDSLQSARPQLALQTRKAGTQPQARKKYRLTVQGLRRAERMARTQESETERE